METTSPSSVLVSFVGMGCGIEQIEELLASVAL